MRKFTGLRATNKEPAIRRKTLTGGIILGFNQAERKSACLKGFRQLEFTRVGK